MLDPPRQPASPALHLLGRWRLDGSPSRPGEPGGSGRRLLAMLALRGPASRAEIRGTLWPAASESAAGSRLRTVLWRLSDARETLLTEQGDTVALNDGVAVDVHLMRQAATDLHSGLAISDPSIFHADLLPQWQDDWLLVDRERIRQTRLHALEALAARLTDQGRFPAALDAALAVLQTDPLRESAHRAIIQVHLAEDNLGEAIRAYRACVLILRDEIGVGPSASLRALVGDAAVTLR